MNRLLSGLLLMAGLLAVPALAQAGASSPYGGVDHTRKIKTYNGPATCMGCHSTSKMGTNLAEDVYNSAHFQLRTPTCRIDMPGGGSHGMLDRACGLPGTTMMADNYADIAVAPDGTTHEDGCGNCHVAYKPPYYYRSAAEALPDIDCLRCHAAVYGKEWDDPAVIAQYGQNPEPHGRNVVVLTDGSRTWSQDRSLKTARSVGNLPKSEFCLRCHEHGYTGYKRATPFLAATDAHAAAGVECHQCHVMERHRIARGNLVTDGVANDLTTVEVSCANTTCHGSAPHAAANAATLNKHAVNVTCEACHVAQMDAERNITRRAWAPFTLDPRTGAWEATPVTTAGEYPGLFDAYSEYLPAGTWPTLRWFDGRASMLAQAFAGYADRSSNGGSARLFAFKPFVSGMLFDAGWLPGPPRDGSFDLVSQTWPFSMKAFYENNWEKFRAFGFVDAQYATAAAYWAARPDMAAMLNSFPMMLQFDRAAFLSRAGEVSGEPQPGPQSAAAYPGIARAINIGMGRMGIDMGYFPPASDPEAVGPYLWSGQFFGMWVPVNMDPSSPLAGELGSLITMSHAIKGSTQMGEPCFTCHLTPEEYGGTVPAGQKRLDFALLGYPDVDGNGRVDPRYGDMEAAKVKPTVAAIQMSLTSKRKAETLNIKVLAKEAGSGSALANVQVNGVLSGPAGAPGLPATYSGTTLADGSVSFSYAQSALASGTYTFTVNTLVYGGETVAVSDCQSLTK